MRRVQHQIGLRLVISVSVLHLAARATCEARGQFRQLVAAEQGGRFALPDVSSTFIRDRLSNAQEADADLAGLVPPSVLTYIRRHHLYESA